MKIFLFLILSILVGCSQLPANRTDKLSILQGVTNTKEVEFSIVSLKSTELRFELRDESGEILAPDETKIVARDFSDYVVHKVVFVRDSAKEYNLYVFQGDKILDQRLVGKGQRSVSKLRVAVVAGMNDHLNKKFGIWETLASQNPEYLLMIGDNVYADAAGIAAFKDSEPETMWKRYVESRLRLPFFFQQKLIPTHALWNTHDFGTKDVFEAFYAQDMSDDDWSKGFGVGGVLSLGDFNLYFLDGKSFRSDDSKSTHLGLDQTAWFYSKLREEATPSFIIKGDQFFGGYHAYSSFEGKHPDQFQQFVNELKQINTPFIFLSGDRNMSEIMQFPRTLFGKPSFEITSGPLHAKPYDLAEDKNPWRVVSKRGDINFIIIDNEAKDNHWFMEVQSLGEKGELYFRRELAVYIKDLQDNLKEVRKRRSGKRRYRRIRSRRR